MSYKNTAASHLLISIYQDGVQVQLHVVEYPQKYFRYSSILSGASAVSCASANALQSESRPPLTNHSGLSSDAKEIDHSKETLGGCIQARTWTRETRDWEAELGIAVDCLDC